MEQRTAWEIFKREVEAPFAGWNFQRLTQTGRMQEAPLTWNYASIVKALMNGIDSMLDMGTGGENCSFPCSRIRRERLRQKDTSPT